MYQRSQRTCVSGLSGQSLPNVASCPAGSACGMPYAPDDGFSAAGFQSDSCCQRASRQSNCAAPICSNAYVWASSTLGVGGATSAVGGVGSSADELRREREIVVARSVTVDSAALGVGCVPCARDVSEVNSVSVATSAASATGVTVRSIVSLPHSAYGTRCPPDDSELICWLLAREASGL